MWSNKVPFQPIITLCMEQSGVQKPITLKFCFSILIRKKCTELFKCHRMSTNKLAVSRISTSHPNKRSTTVFGAIEIRPEQFWMIFQRVYIATIIGKIAYTTVANSFICLQNRARLSWKSKTNLDSAVKGTYPMRGTRHLA